MSLVSGYKAFGEGRWYVLCILGYDIVGSFFRESWHSSHQWTLDLRIGWASKWQWIMIFHRGNWWPVLRFHTLGVFCSVSQQTYWLAAHLSHVWKHHDILTISTGPCGSGFQLPFFFCYPKLPLCLWCLPHWSDSLEYYLPTDTRQASSTAASLASTWLTEESHHWVPYSVPFIP